MAEFMDGIMDGLKNFGKAVSDTAEVVAMKAEETVEVQKLKAKICGLRRDNSKDFQKIGRLVYERFTKEDEVDGAFLELCQAIYERKATIAEYQETIEKIRE